MTVEHVEFLVEEPSSEAALLAILPKLLPGKTFAVHVHQGKSDLLARLPLRLAGYSRWLPETWRIVVLVDRDDEDCAQLKAKLESFAHAAGLGTRSSPLLGAVRVINRVVVEELEAWYFGDWDAVMAAYPRLSPAIPAKATYRDPDQVRGGTWEAFERELQRHGYHKGGLAKIQAARDIGPHIDPARNRSKSFQVFRDALAAL